MKETDKDVLIGSLRGRIALLEEKLEAKTRNLNELKASVEHLLSVCEKYLPQLKLK